MSWIQTYTGKQFWPLAPRRQDVCVEDLAHALSLLCRFNGHCWEFYSVAQHSCLVATEVAKGLAFQGVLSPQQRLSGVRFALLHDAAEAYLSDVPRPVKGSLSGYKGLERDLLFCICGSLKVSWRLPGVIELVKEMDDRALATEQRDLMGPAPEEWGLAAKPFPDKIVPQSPKQAEKDWLWMWSCCEF